MFVSIVSGLNSTGSEPDGEIIPPPPAAKNAKMSTLGQGCRLVPMLQPAVGILLEAVGDAVRAYMQYKGLLREELAVYTAENPTNQ